MSELMVQETTVRNLEIVGEATKSLYPTFRASHPEAPGADMAGVRVVLVHRYAAVDLEIVWRIHLSTRRAMLSRLAVVSRLLILISLSVSLYQCTTAR